jgi:DNA primase
VLTIDEGREQNAAIHAAQRERRTLGGSERPGSANALKTAPGRAAAARAAGRGQPYANRLTFLDDRTRTRRDHEKYLTLIDAIALLHQHQREVKTRCVTETGAALRRGRRSRTSRSRTSSPMKCSAARSMSCRRRRASCWAWSSRWSSSNARRNSIGRAQYRFSRRQVRECTRWGDTQLKIHLARLTELGIPARASGRPRPVLRVRAAVRCGRQCCARHIPERLAARQRS